MTTPNNFSRPGPEDARVERVATELARYVTAHPDACDTADGIARWWLARQRLDDARELVTAALDRLVSRGVVERQDRNGVTLFSARHAPTSHSGG